MRILFAFFLSFQISIGYSQMEKVSVVSTNRDTLWLRNNDIGLLIARSWEMGNLPPEEKVPVILIVDALPDNTRNGKRKFGE